MADVTLTFNAENLMGAVISQASGQVDGFGKKVAATSAATASLKGVEQMFRGIAAAVQAPVAGLQQVATAATAAGAAARGATAGFQALGQGATASVQSLAQQIQKIPGMFAGVKIGPSFDAMIESVHRVRDEIARMGRTTPESVKAAQRAVEDLTKTFGTNLESARGLSKGQIDAFQAARAEVLKLGAAWSAQAPPINRAAQAAASAAGSMGAFAGSLRALGGQLLILLGPLVTLAGAFGLLKKAISNADDLRDIAAGIRIVSSSAEEAAATLKFFEENARRTRSTNDELAESFRNLFPTGRRLGFNADQFREFTVTIHNFATATKRSVAEVEQAFVQLTSGRITGTNVIVKALGLDVGALRAGQIGIQDFVRSAITGMGAVAAEGEKMGQTLNSTFKLLADRLIDAFGEGFNQAAGKAQTGMQGVLDALTDPRILQALETLGKAFATLGPAIATMVDIGVRGLLALVTKLDPILAPIFKLLDAVSSRTPQAAPSLADLRQYDERRLGPRVPGKISIVDPDEVRQISEAEQAVRRYREELDALLNKGTAWTRQQRLLNDAIGELSTRIGRSAAIKQFAPQLEAMMKAAKGTASSMGVLNDEVREFSQIKFEENAAAMAKELDTLVKAIPQGQFPKVLLKVSPEMLAELRNDLNKARNEFKDFLDDVERDVAAMQLEAEIEFQVTTLKEPLGDIFTDIFATGGKNFGAIAAKTLQDGMKGAGNTLADVFTMGLGALTGEGTRIDPRTGRPVLETGSTAGQIGQGLLAGAGGAAAIWGQIGGPEITSQQIAHQIGQAWVSAGSLWGAIIATVVTSVTSYLAINEQQSKYKYGIPSIVGGRAVFDPERNIRATEAEAIRKRIQETFDSVYNGFAVALLRVSARIPDLLRNISIEFTRGLDQGGYIGREASENFMKHLDQLIAEGIPSEVGARFRPYFEDAFRSMGFTAERFDELWTILSDMDPEKGLQNLNALIDIAQGFQRWQDMPGWNTTVGAGFDIRTGILQQEYQKITRTPAEALMEDLGSQIIDMAEGLSQLTGEAQIQRAKQLVSLMDQWQEAARGIAREQLLAAENIKRSFGATIRELELEGLKTPEGAPDTQAQLKYLQRYADELIEQLRGATSFGEITGVSDELRNVIMRIRQLGGTGDQEEAYRQWALENLRMVQQIALDRIQALGAEMEDATQHLRDTIDGMIEAFQGVTDALNDVRDRPPGEPPTPPPPPPGGDDERPDTGRGRPRRAGGGPGGDDPEYAFGDTIDEGKIRPPGRDAGAILEEIRDVLNARREDEAAIADRIAAALEDGVRVQSGELRVVVERADTGERVAEFTQRVQQNRARRGRRSATG